MNAPDDLVLVDAQDREIGVAPKMECHIGEGRLHRAFSVFVYGPGGRILLQQRSAAKPLWPMYWSNSCCGHPLPGERVQAAAERRTQEEMGIQCEARFLYKFRYQARYSDDYSENELCHVFEAAYDGEMKPDPAEIAAWRWIAPDELTKEIDRHPERFTPWMKLEWAELRRPRSQRRGQDAPAPSV